MRNTILSYLLLPLFAGLSFSLSAATVQAEHNPVAVQVPVAQAKSPTSGSVDLNSADALALQTSLTGIGKAKAEAIVAYREANGPFSTVDELLEIKGIGKALLERNRDRLTVD
ncbi:MULTISPECIES: ComEA family DNA-binding protein [unclassified Pseudomonas]|uniref:ComEA family DNA-binding protein n=1 Tax=unclassified Pseudomonas TaxID=196821 RepID=UPI0024480188|nr:MULTISPECIES: ComEA family DNA-binding protein [unclassified Pseudomonas]MDH0304885.1 ComEA family DNA-binding protein [Pseudomonas sp. GD04091]MDH1988275.1 ComEA family DNA-binding protein [Pseudomonas sp. GD03689]